MEGENNMTELLSARIINGRDNRGLDYAQSFYRKLFIKTSIYKKWKESVDSILEEEGYADCIVTE